MTGRSTVRRTFAALLDDALGLPAIPRNPTKPERFANYGLNEDDDRRLTEWMRTNLELAVWPTIEAGSLDEVKRRVLRALKPPPNLKDVVTPWSRAISKARALKAEQARRWADSRG
ncbi:MAG: GIY-YIG nuclease family protein [Solirubrobacterales bacterium]